MSLSIPEICKDRVAVVGAGFTLLTGTAGLTGWVFGAEGLKGTGFSGISMKANTAICLILISTAFLLLRPLEVPPPRLWLGRALAFVAGAVGLLTFLQHMIPVDFGIDQLLFTEEPGAVATASPGRMGPPASLSLFLAAVALWAIPGRGAIVAQFIGVLVAAIVSIPILGYAYDIAPLYGISRFTGIALHTALALLTFSVALMVVRPSEGFMKAFCSDNVGGVMARRLLVPGLLLPFTIAWLRTVGEKVGWVDPALGRPLLTIALTIALITLIALNARTMNRLEQRRLAEEREKAADLEKARLAAERARAEAEKASRAKTDFIAALSHELRTPLSPVVLSLSSLERHPKFPPELREDLQIVRQNLRLETRLISDLLDVTRIENQKLPLELIDVDLHQVLRDTVRLCANDESAPAVLDLRADTAWVKGDDMRLRQVFWNLLSNAQKFTPATGRIVLTTEKPAADRLRVTVRDNGAGISAETLTRLFQPFEQGQFARPRGGSGLGLGLSIARRLVEAHQGTISASSDGEGRGAAFVVELPALDRVPVAIVTPEPTSPPSRAAARILLVEDHAATQYVLKKLLNGLGHSVTTAGTVAEAVTLGQANPHDVLLSDLGLPDGSGIDVIQALAGQFRGRAIALSGYGTEADIAASREAGFTVHLVKPVELPAVIAALNLVASGTAGSVVCSPAVARDALPTRSSSSCAPSSIR